MKRREIWTAAGGGSYASKPRPVVIIQDDRFDRVDSVTIVPFTTDSAELSLFRISIEATVTNGLRNASHLMGDKIMTLRRTDLGRRLGTLATADMLRLERAIVVFLGLGH